MQRIAQYLHDLYGDEIEERSLQLQSLATQSEALGDKALDEFNTIDPSEYAPLNLSQEPIATLPQASDHQNSNSIETQQANDEHNQASHEPIEQPLFEAEFIDPEVKNDIIAEPTPEPIINTSVTPQLPKDFTLIAQQEKDWDEGRLMIQGQRRLTVFLLLFAVAASALSFYFGQSWDGQSTATSKVEIQVNSTPDRAKVLIDGNYVGDTPLRHVLASEKKIQLEVVKAGYQNTSRVITPKLGQSLMIYQQLSPNE